MWTVVRYQTGEKPAWILEIEEARATSSGAIGQSEAWTGNSRKQNHQLAPQQHVDDQQDEEIDKKKYEAEEQALEEVRSSDDTVVESEQIAHQATAETAPLPEQLTDETVTSQQLPVSADLADDVISPQLHTVQDLCDVSVVSSTQQSMEHVTMTRDTQYESPPASVCSDVHDEMTSHTADVSESSPHDTAGDFEACQNNEVTSGDVITDQQLVTDDQERHSVVSEPRRHEQQPPTTSSSSPSSSSSSSSTATATVARQQTALSSNTTPTTVDAVDHGRAKKRHTDKSKMNEHSADVRLSFIQ